MSLSISFANLAIRSSSAISVVPHCHFDENHQRIIQLNCDDQDRDSLV